MSQKKFDMEALRSGFPALQQRDDHGRPFVYFDGPGGTQVPETVSNAMAEYFRTSNANHGGRFITSRRNDAVIDRARGAMVDFLNASHPEEIVFGANMTTLTYNLSRVIGRYLNAGDEIVVTRLDHDANIAPWAALQERGIVIKWIDFDPSDCRLDLKHLDVVLSERTKLVAVGYASNALGTINPIQKIASAAHKVDAWLWVDAVHYAPHGSIDVQALGCDFLIVSAYKFFGPHVGILYGRLPLLELLEAYKVRPADPRPPYKFETGTLNHEGLAGVTAAVDYLAGLGEPGGFFEDMTAPSDAIPSEDRRKKLKRAMRRIAAYEQSLFAYLLQEIQKIPGITVYGITNPMEFGERCPTLAFTKSASTPEQIAEALGNQGIFVWDGNYYAISVTERLGLEESGGMVRVGLTHYSTKAEVDRFISAVAKM